MGGGVISDGGTEVASTVGGGVALPCGAGVAPEEMQYNGKANTCEREVSKVVVSSTFSSVAFEDMN